MVCYLTIPCHSPEFEWHLSISQSSTDDYHLSQMSTIYTVTSHIALSLEWFYTRRTINSIQLGMFCETGILLLVCQNSKHVHGLLNHKYASALVKLINLCTPYYCQESYVRTDALCCCTYIQYKMIMVIVDYSAFYSPLDLWCQWS